MQGKGRDEEAHTGGGNANGEGDVVQHGRDDVQVEPNDKHRDEEGGRRPSIERVKLLDKRKPPTD